jgi:hypothetical protein
MPKAPISGDYSSATPLLKKEGLSLAEIVGLLAANQDSIYKSQIQMDKNQRQLADEMMEMIARIERVNKIKLSKLLHFHRKFLQLFFFSHKKIHFPSSFSQLL